MGGSVAGVLQVRHYKLHKYHLANQFIPDLKAMFAVIHETFMSMLGSMSSQSNRVWITETPCIHWSHVAVI